MNAMFAFERLRLGLAVAAFAAAYLCQPLALNACAVSCEAARAARTPAVAAPCHHTTSCATQVSQPTAPGSTTAPQVLAPAVSIASVEPVFSVALAPPLTFTRLADVSPPLDTHLRL